MSPGCAVSVRSFSTARSRQFIRPEASSPTNSSDFMGMDPVEAQAENLHSFNRYAYANNNPYKFVDPDERAAESVTNFISLGISVGISAQDPSLANALGVLGDTIGTAVPFLPAGVEIIRSGLKAADEVGNVARVTKSTPQGGLVIGRLDDLEAPGS
jgi:hypothetical protein